MPTTDPMIDSELMLRFQAGDETSFEKLVDRHQQRVMNLVYRFLGGSSDAEDIAQEVFVNIFKAKDQYQPTAKFTTWLYVICRNTCFKVLAKNKNQPISFQDFAEQKNLEWENHFPDNYTPSPAEQLELDEMLTAIQQSIQSLPEQQRFAFILSKYEQLSYEEIAETMDCTSKAVKSLLHRAKIRLKEEMEIFFQK